MQKSLTDKLGEVEAKEVISEAVYFISMGSNDYMGGYLGSPKMQEQYNPEQFVGMVIGNLTQTIQVSLIKALSPAVYNNCAFISLIT